MRLPPLHHDIAGGDEIVQDGPKLDASVKDAIPLPPPAPKVAKVEWKGEDISIVPSETGGGQIIDLMEALKASLAKKPEAKPAPEKKAAAGGEATARKPAKRAPGKVAQMRTEAGRKG